MSLRVALFGELRVSVDGRAIDPRRWTRRHARGLVALLALAPAHRLHREQVADTFWPELAPDTAARNLRKALHHARRILSEDPAEAASLLVGQGATLSLPRDAWVDVDAFEAALAGARRGGAPADYDAPIALYAGELLPEDRYEPWIGARPEELRSEYVAALSEQAGAWESRGELDLASAALARAIVDEPFDEDLARRLMRVRALAGRRTQALEAYERLRVTLDAELGAEPSAATQRLREEIATGGIAAPELDAVMWEQVGDLRMLSGDVAGAAVAYGSAVGSNPDAAPEIGRRHRKAAQAHLGIHDVDAAAPHLARASALAKEPAESGRVALLEANLAWERGDLGAALEMAARARALAEASGDEHDVAAAHEALAMIHHFRGDWRDGLREEIERLRHASHDDQQLARVFDIHHCIGQYHLYGDGLWQDVEGYAREILEHAERAGAVRAEAFAWCLLGESLLLRWRFDEAAGCLERSGELHASLGERSGALAWQRLAELLVCAGEPEAAAPHLRRAAAIATISPMARHLWGRIHATTAFAALERGEPDRSVVAVRAAAASAARTGDCPTCSALLHPVAAEAFAALGRPDDVRPHVDAARGVADMFESSAWRAMALAAESSLRASEGDAAAAAALDDEAARRYEQAGQPFWSSRARSRPIG